MTSGATGARLLNRRGVLLVELLVALIIFSMVFGTLALVWSNTYRHMVYSLRRMVYKNSVTATIHSVDRDMAAASRVESPSTSTLITQDLLMVGNVGSDGCFPLNGASATQLPITWVYYCFAKETTALLGSPITSTTYGGTYMALYRYSGTLSPSFRTAPSCPSPSGSGVTLWQGAKTEVSGLSATMASCGLAVSGAKQDVMLRAVSTGYFLVTKQQSDRVRLYVHIVLPLSNKNIASQPLVVSSTAEFNMPVNAEY